MKQIQGFAALLDVLGFRSIVSGHTSAHDLEKYLAAVEAGIAGKGDTRAVKFVLFSDSIIITTIDDTDESLRILLRACSRLFGLLLESEIGVRGAISHGLFFRESRDNGVFVAGRPIVDAYEFEQRQDWIGIMLTPSVLKAKPDLPGWCRLPNPAPPVTNLEEHLPWMLLAQHNPNIPFHEDYFDGHAVVPTPGGSSTIEMAPYLVKCCQQLAVLKRLAPDPKAQRKYAATTNWLNKLRERWSALLNVDGFPNSVEYY